MQIAFFCICILYASIHRSLNSSYSSHSWIWHLEMRGAPIFDGYYRNPEATAEAFTSDGWFRTGDQAFVDSEGNLNLIGRSRETLNVNGVKYLLQEIVNILEQALTSRTSRIVCFPYRSQGSYTEQPCVVYVSPTNRMN